MSNNYHGLIGRQPFRPGQWSRYQGHSHKTYVQNNFYGNSVFGGGYGYGNQNCCDGGGNNKFMNWMVGIGGGMSLLGTILGMFNWGGGGGKKEVAPEERDVDEYNRRSKPTNDNGDDSIKAERKSSDAIEFKYTTDAREIPKKVETHSFTVRREGDQCDNPYNVTTAMYTDENGNPIPKSEIMAVRNAVFGENKGLKVGEVQLPDTVSVHGKTYKYNPNGKPTLGSLGAQQMEYYTSTAVKTSGGGWKAILDGGELDGIYTNRDEAIAVAKKAGEAKKAAHERDNKK